MREEAGSGSPCSWFGGLSCPGRALTLQAQLPKCASSPVIPLPISPPPSPLGPGDSVLCPWQAGGRQTDCKVSSSRCRKSQWWYGGCRWGQCYSHPGVPAMAEVWCAHGHGMPEPGRTGGPGKRAPGSSGSAQGWRHWASGRLLSTGVSAGVTLAPKCGRATLQGRGAAWFPGLPDLQGPQAGVKHGFLWGVRPWERSSGRPGLGLGLGLETSQAGSRLAHHAQPLESESKGPHMAWLLGAGSWSPDSP